MANADTRGQPDAGNPLSRLHSALTAVLFAVLCGRVVSAPFSVLIPSDPKPWERTAADELKTWLSQAAGGGEVRIGGCDAVVFHVGDTELAGEKGFLSRDMPDEQWVVKSFGRDVVLNGGGSHGAIYAVSHFLEDAVGVRFWNDTETDVPEAKA